MRDANPIRTLGDYSKPSHEGYRNTIELLEGNNVVPLRSDTIRLVQNGCSFHRLWSEDPNQHLKDYLKLVDSLNLNVDNKERTRLRSISTWEDLTTRFLAQFFSPVRTVKLRNDILMFQQHQGESLSEAWNRFKDFLHKVPHHGIDIWLQLSYNLKDEYLHGDNAKNLSSSTFSETQFKGVFLPPKGVSATDLLNKVGKQDFEDFPRCEPNIRPVNDQVPSALMVHLTVHIIVLLTATISSKKVLCLNVLLEDARKMTQDKTRIPSHKDMASTRAHCTPNACTPKPRNIYRSSPVSKCSGGMSNGEPLVNSRAKVQSPKIRNNNPVEPKNHTHKPGRQNGIGQRFSLNKSSAVHEKPHTPRSYLRWKPTGRIFKTVSLRWIPTRKVFIDSTTKVDSEPTNGSNDDITYPYESIKRFMSSRNSNLMNMLQMTFGQNSSSLVLHQMTFGQNSSSLVLHQKMFGQKRSRALFFHLDDKLQKNPIFHISVDISRTQTFLDKLTEDDQEKSKVIEESDSTIPDPSHQTVTSTPPVIAPFTDVSSTKPSSLVTPPPINTEATTIITSLPKITPFISLQLRVARLEQEMSEVKKTDHSADVLASIKSQVPTSIKNQESEKIPKEIIRIKREQGEEKQDSTYSIRSTDKVALEESLIADEDAMDKEVAVKVKDHKRKHDSDDEEDDDDDKGPSAGSNQGSSKETRESDASTSYNILLLPHWWQIMEQEMMLLILSDAIASNNIPDHRQSLMHMLNLNPSPHKEDSLVLLSEIPLLCQRRGLLIRLRSSRELDPAGDSDEEKANSLVGSRCVIDLSSPKPVSPPCQESFTITFTTNIRTTAEQFSSCNGQVTAPAHISSGPGPQLLTPRTNLVRTRTTTPSKHLMFPPTKNDCDLLFCLCWMSTSILLQVPHKPLKKNNLMLFPTSVLQEDDWY
ncbi:zinc finger, CCHC-type containing protein [Tanacetum coccineum]